MATRWSDADIAAPLNRMGMQTGQGKTWTARRVGSLRTVHKIHGYRSAEKNGEWLTLTDAAKKTGVTAHPVVQSQQEVGKTSRRERGGQYVGVRGVAHQYKKK